jgi:hypothetical protein
MAPGLRVGAARSTITPPLGVRIAGYLTDRIAQDIHDDLYAKAIVLETAEASLAVVVCDLIDLKLACTDQAKAIAQDLTRIPADHILISATHTHFGPSVEHGVNLVDGSDYAGWLPRRIADSVKMAQNRLRPARVVHASGQCTEEVHNRRYRMKDGSVVTNPGFLNPDIVGPAGPTDPEIGLLAFLDDESEPIAVLANYPLHYVGGCSGASGSADADGAAVDLSITADYFGAFDQALQRMAAREFVAVMMNGCCGDINNIDISRPQPEYPHPWYQIERVANVVAAATYKAWQGVRLGSCDDAPTLGAATRRFAFRRRAFSSSEITAARELARRSPPRNLVDQEGLHAQTVVRLSEQPPEQETMVQAFRIGEVGLVGLPGEIFVEIGLEIKRRSPLGRTLIAELANDSLGYVPTSAAFEQGSYEVVTTAASPQTAPSLVDYAIALLYEVANQQ